MCEEIQKQVDLLIKLLVDGQYDQIESLTKSVRLPADQMKSAINQYGRKLVEPPREAYKLMDVVEVQTAKPERWSITMPLWTEEEGRSDLTIELTLIKSNGAFTVELDDLRVL